MRPSQFKGASLSDPSPRPPRLTQHQKLRLRLFQQRRPEVPMSPLRLAQMWRLHVTVPPTDSVH